MSTDFQIPTITETAPTPTPATPATPAAPPVPEVKQTRELDHTPGGLPAIPLAVITSNTTIAGLSAVAVTAGPIAAAATAGSLLVSAVAVRAAGNRRSARRPNKPRTPQQRNQQRAPQRSSTSNSSGSSRGNSGGSSTRRTPAPAPRTTSSLRSTPRRTPTTPTRTSPTGSGTRRTNTTGPAKTNKPSTLTPTRNSKKTTAPKAASRAQQIKALRKDKATTAPTRRERRVKDLADRRALRDGRRLDKRNNRKTPLPGAGGVTKKPTTPTNSPRTGSVSPAAKQRKTINRPLTPKKTGNAADTLRPTRTDRIRTKLRTARDQATHNRAARIQQARNKAKARAALAKNRTKARTRYGLKAAGLGLLSAPVGLLGCLTTPLGKWLGWSWLQYPGRRLYRRLTATARYNRDARLADAANTYASTTNPETLEATSEQTIADTVARAPRNTYTADLTGDPDMSEDIKLHFLETSEETVSAARSYEPGGMLHVRQVIKAMPVALENWAMAFAVLAEKSDAEFPLGDEIGEGLDDIHQQMRQLISHAEDLAQTFDRIHEADIDRLINPRKSREAEKTWDTAANEDYDGE